MSWRRVPGPTGQSAPSGLYLRSGAYIYLILLLSMVNEWLLWFGPTRHNQMESIYSFLKWHATGIYSNMVDC